MYAASNEELSQNFFQLEDSENLQYQYRNYSNSQKSPYSFDSTKPKPNPAYYPSKFKDKDNEEAKKMPFLKKTKLCLCFQMGNCANGDSCDFAHGEHELRQQPDFYKTALCIPFMSGKECKYGNKCRFAHGQNELRPRPDINEPGPTLRFPSNACSNNTYGTTPPWMPWMGQKSSCALVGGYKISPSVQFESLQEKMERSKMNEYMEAPPVIMCSTSTMDTQQAVINSGNDLCGNDFLMVPTHKKMATLSQECLSPLDIKRPNLLNLSSKEVQQL